MLCWGELVKLYRTIQGAFVEEGGRFYALSTLTSAEAWDSLVCDVDLKGLAMAAVNSSPVESFDPTTVLAPAGNQEVWAAGVTYFRSRAARMEESKDAGGGNFYDRVYTAAARAFLQSRGMARRWHGKTSPDSVRCEMVSS